MIMPAETVARLRAAYDKLPADKQQLVKDQMFAAHSQALRHRRSAAAGASGAVATSDTSSHVQPELALAFEALFPAEAKLAAGEQGALLDEEGIPYVGADGSIYGTGKYENLDVGWILAAAIWLENVFYKHQFHTDPATLQLSAETVTLAFLADWGTGNFGKPPAPPIQISRVLQKDPPDVAIHLGDVYYAGTSDEQRSNFLADWAPGKSGSFALNSNHEMYPGGDGYFKTLLAHPAFAGQRRTSYFSIETRGWIVAGLDSAYYSSVWGAYMDGALDEGHQIPFLSAVAKKAQQTGRKVIVLTHHNGLALDGTAPNNLWRQVMAAFPKGSAPAFWYWGHLHTGVVYSAQQAVFPRCLGHGAIPWGKATALVGQPNVAWFEEKKNPVNPGLQVMNGFVRLTLRGKDLTDAYFDQTGAQTWP